jgi:peptidoglycan/LPS O-acetylase OafA/YrhL
MKRERFYWLDWLRFIAALMVMIYHARNDNWGPLNNLNIHDHVGLVKAFFFITRPAVEWVMVFFVLSGFLVGGKTIERVLHQNFDPWAFALDRLTRIWTPLLPVLLLSGAIALWVGVPVSLWVMLGNLLGLQSICCDFFAGNAPLWSLSQETWFYLLAGFTATALTRSRHCWWLYLGLAGILMILSQHHPEFLSCWLMGAFAYGFIPPKKSTGILALGLGLAWLGALLSLLQLDAAKSTAGDLGLSHWLPSQITALEVESLGSALVVANICLLAPVSPFLIKLEGLGTTLAAFSYTLYLIHYPILLLWDHYIPARSPQFDSATFLIFILKVLSCLALAWLWYLPFEAQTSRVRHWLKRRFNQALAP